MTYLDAKLLDLLFRLGGVKRKELEQFNNWEAALRAIAKRNDLVRGVTPAGETYFCVKGREARDE